MRTSRHETAIREEIEEAKKTRETVEYRLRDLEFERDMLNTKIETLEKVLERASGAGNGDETPGELAENTACA